MLTINENQIYNMWQDEIERICKMYKSSYFDFDEKFSIACIGFVRAVRTYRPGFVKFKPYMTHVIIKELDCEKLAISRQKRVEQYNVSIDKMISTEYEKSYSQCIADPKNTEMHINITQMINFLEPLLKKIVIMLFCGYNKREIVKCLHINPQNYDQQLAVIKKQIIKNWEL